MCTNYVLTTTVPAVAWTSDFNETKAAFDVTGGAIHI